jgi:hypothetical protein
MDLEEMEWKSVNWIYLADRRNRLLVVVYVGVLINFWLFLFPIFLLQHNQKNFFDGLKKLEQRSHKCVELRGEYVE